MAVGITTIDDKDLDERYVKLDGSNGKAPNAVNADYAVNAGTANVANGLNGVLPENQLPVIGEATFNDQAGSSDVSSKIFATEVCPNNCSNGTTIYHTHRGAIKRDAYGRVVDLGRINVAYNCNCQCQD